MLAKMKDLGVQHCKDDKWSDETVKCMSDAKTQGDAQGCYTKMAPEQQEKMTKAMMELMMPSGGAGAGAGAGAGSAAAGSAAADGSAAAGGSAAGDSAGSAGSGDSAGSAAAPK
jgi:hypothetical protein